MRALRAFVIIFAATAIAAAMVGVFLLRRGVAQESYPAQPAVSADDRGALGQYEQLITSLSKSGDTNSATEVAKLVTAMHTERAAFEIAITLRILENLRSGHTNEAMQLLESGLDGAVMSFDGPPGSQRDQGHDAVLKMAREYRRKYPYKQGVAGTDAAVDQVFESLPK